MHICYGDCVKKNVTEINIGKPNVRRHAVYVYGNREVDHVFENLI